MYGWIWRNLPGPMAVRVGLALALVAGVVALLMFVVFPWAEPLLPFNNVTTHAVHAAVSFQSCACWWSTTTTASSTTWSSTWPSWGRSASSCGTTTRRSPGPPRWTVSTPCC